MNLSSTTTKTDEIIKKMSLRRYNKYNPTKASSIAKVAFSDGTAINVDKPLSRRDLHREEVKNRRQKQ